MFHGQAGIGITDGIHAAGEARQHGIRLLGVICSFVFLCGCVSNFMGSDGGYTFHKALESRNPFLVEYVGVSDHTKHKLPRHEAGYRDVGGDVRPEDSCTSFLAHNEGFDSFNVLCGNTRTPHNRHLASRGLSKVFENKGGHRFAERVLRKSDIGSKLSMDTPTSFVNEPAGHPESGECNDRQNTITEVCNQRLDCFCPRLKPPSLDGQLSASGLDVRFHRWSTVTAITRRPRSSTTSFG